CTRPCAIRDATISIRSSPITASPATIRPTCPTSTVARFRASSHCSLKSVEGQRPGRACITNWRYDLFRRGSGGLSLAIAPRRFELGGPMTARLGVAAAALVLALGAFPHKSFATSIHTAEEGGTYHSRFCPVLAEQLAHSEF